MGWIRWGSVMLFAGVLLGAFGAHGLKHSLSPEAREVYQTAVFYHLIHGVGLLIIGALTLIRPGQDLLQAAGCALVVGIILFSGSLYLLSLTGVAKFGIITPIGGLCFVVGWLLLALASRA